MKNPFELTLAEWVAMSPEERQQSKAKARELAQAALGRRWLGGNNQNYQLLFCSPETIQWGASEGEPLLPTIDAMVKIAIHMDRVLFEFWVDGYEEEAEQREAEFMAELTERLSRSSKPQAE